MERRCSLELNLDYYTTFTKPGFAMLVTGEWGVGKTFQIEKYFENNPSKTNCYISLFGLTTLEEVYAAVFVKMYSTKSKTKNLFSKFKKLSIPIKGIPVPIGQISFAVINEIIKQQVDVNKTIIFDDLERCTICINDLLGVINHYVENEWCRVIVVTHDDKLENQFTEKKEKIFGLITKATPDIESAYADFINACQAPSAIKHIKKLILDTFLATGCKSLRVLKYTINDCTRLLSVLDERHRDNNELFNFFVSLVVNYRVGKLYKEDFIKRDELLDYKERSNNPSYKERNKIIDSLLRPCGMYFANDILTSETLSDCIVNGYYDREKINQEINISRPYNIMANRPWYKIIRYHFFSQNEVDSAIDDLFKLIENLEIEEHGELLHSFNLLLKLSHCHQINLSFNKIWLLFCDYLNKLQYMNRIKPSNRNDHEYAFGYYGFSLSIQDDWKEYSDKMKDRLKYHRQIAFFKQYPDFINEIIDALENDVENFVFLISYKSGVQGKYSTIPVLSKIKPYKFVELWLSLDGVYWQSVHTALYVRYKNRYGMLSDERTWIRGINAYLRHRAAKETGLYRLRIEALILQE